MRIFLAESDPELRVGLQFLINQQSNLKVIGITDNGKRLKKKIKASRPDVLLLDWFLPGKPMNELIADIKALDLQLIIIAISSRPEDERAAIAAGVDAYATMAASPNKLIDLLSTMRSKSINSGSITSKEENL
jgi:two-component system response regulator MtrA